MMAYAVGRISGGHFNPAVSLGLAAANRFAWRDTGAYIVAQVAGGVAAGRHAFCDRHGQEGLGKRGASPGTGTAPSPGAYSLQAGLVSRWCSPRSSCW